MIQKEKLRQILADARILPGLSQLLPGDQQWWLVGGALRDCLLGIEATDFDFAISGDPTRTAKIFARTLKGTWFWLDSGRKQSRVVAGPPEKRISYDFAPLRAPTVEEDLELRDFTINSLALPLQADGTGPVLDLLGGERDLRDRVLKACSPSSMAEDPLRVLKGVRHSVGIGLAIDVATREWMVAAATRIHEIAPERCGVEMARLLGSGNPVQAVKRLREVEGERALFDFVFPAGSAEETERLLGRCEAVRADLESGMRRAGTSLDGGRLVEGEWTLLALVYLGLLLRGCGLGRAATVGPRLSFGRRASLFLARLLELDSGSLAELENVAPLRRSRALWIESLEVEPEAALLSLISLSSSPPEEHVEEAVRLILDYRRESQSGKIPELVDGHRIGALLGIPAGPEVGRILARLRQAEISGRVRSVPEAEQFLKEVGDERD